MADIDYPALWQYLAHQFPLGRDSIHGPCHWRRVEQNGLRLADRTGARVEVVRLFALFHDCQRWNDGTDPDHGRRGARLLRSLNGERLAVDPGLLDQVCYACDHHTEGFTSDDPDIGTCWDADRLELSRLGIRAHPQLLSTEAARQPQMLDWAWRLSEGAREGRGERGR